MADLSDQELADIECVDKMLGVVLDHLGERPAVHATVLLLAALGHVCGQLEKHEPGTLAQMLPGMVSALSKSVHAIATSDEEAFFPSKRSH